MTAKMNQPWNVEGYTICCSGIILITMCSNMSVDEQMYGWKDGWMDRHMNEQMDDG